MRKLRAALMVAVLAATAIVAGAAPASAAPGDVVCLTNPLNLATVTYSPGVKWTPQNITFTINGNLSPCTSLSQPSIVAGSYSATGTATLSCLAGGNFTGNILFTWNTGQTSVVTMNFTLDIRLGVVIVLASTGPVTGGTVFVNDTAVLVVALVANPLDVVACGAAGIQSSTGTGNGTFA